MLQGRIPDTILLLARAYLPPKAEYGEDVFVTQGACAGTFSVKDIYMAICDDKVQNMGILWTKIWKLKVPKHVR